MAIPEEAWLCEECGLVHGDEDDAYECCRPRVTEGYLCPQCDKFWSSEDEALCCCDHEHDPDAPTAAELEAHGQARLMP